MLATISIIAPEDVVIHPISLLEKRLIIIPINNIQKESALYIKGVRIMNQAMVENKEPEVFIDLNNGEYLQFDMTLPIQILFDDVMNFVSKTDFE